MKRRRAEKSKKRRQSIPIRCLNPKHAHLLHPIYQPLVIPRRRKLVPRISLAAKIRNRALFYSPRPRAPPFYCIRCTSGTRRLSVAAVHDCSLRKGNASRTNLLDEADVETEQELVLLGTRGKIKDSMAVLEWMMFPQNVEVNGTVIDNVLESPFRKKQQYIPPLSELVQQVLVPPRTGDVHVPEERAFLQKNVPLNPRRAINRRVRNGQLCPHCDRLFATFAEYDAHLKEEENEEPSTSGMCTATADKPPQPTPVLMNCCATVPREYDYDRRQARRAKERAVEAECSGCGENSFPSTVHFHQHIMECGQRMAHDIIRNSLGQ